MSRSSLDVGRCLYREKRANDVSDDLAPPPSRRLPARCISKIRFFASTIVEEISCCTKINFSGFNPLPRLCPALADRHPRPNQSCLQTVCLWKPAHGHRQYKVSPVLSLLMSSSLVSLLSVLSVLLLLLSIEADSWSETTPTS